MAYYRVKTLRRSNSCCGVTQP